MANSPIHVEGDLSRIHSICKCLTVLGVQIRQCYEEISFVSGLCDALLRAREVLVARPCERIQQFKVPDDLDAVSST
jgi:hypothetical protein